MAELPIIENVSRVAFKWGPMIAVNVMHFHQESINEAGLFGALNDNVKAAMWNPLVSSQRVLQVDITPLDGETGTKSFVPPNTANWKGVQGNNPIPAQAAVVKKTTAFRGRSARGRSFIGPVAENITDSGVLEPTMLSGMAAAWSQFQVDMVTDSCPEVVASYKDATAFVVLLYSIRNVAGTMRPRQSRLA